MSEGNPNGFDMVGLSAKRIGDIVIQATVSETYDDALQITNHPVESGPYGNATISDHAFKQPRTVTLKCGWSNTSYEALLGTRAMDVSNGKAAAHDYVTAVYSQLLNLQESREPIELVTSRRKYSSMLIEKLSVEHNVSTAGALMVTATLREVIVVQTRATSLPPYAHQKQQDKTGAVQSRGRKSATPVKEPPRGALIWI